MNSSPIATSFTLSADADKFDVPYGGVFTTKITATRLGYKGPIELALQGLDDNEKCQLSGATIPDGKTVTTLTVTVPKSLGTGALRVLQIVGRATIDKVPFEARVETLAALRTALNGAPNPPAALMVNLRLALVRCSPLSSSSMPENKPIELVQLLGKTSFTVKATRLEKFADAIALAVEGLPAGFQLKTAAIDKGKNEVTLEVVAPRTIAEGDYPSAWSAQGRILGQPGRAALDLTLGVVRPLAVKVTTMGKLPIGGKQKLKVQIVRGDGRPLAPCVLIWPITTGKTEGRRKVDDRRR